MTIIIDVATDAVVGSPIELGPLGLQPAGLAVTPDGSTVYVANKASGTVSFINVATNSAVGSIALPGGGPIGVAVTPDGKLVRLPGPAELYRH